MLQGLGSAVRYKAYKKRPLRSTRLTFGSDFSIGIQLFATIKVPPAATLYKTLSCCILSARPCMQHICTRNLCLHQMIGTTPSRVQGATKSSHTWVSAQRHEPLRSEGAEICEDTGVAKAITTDPCQYQFPDFNSM